MVTTLMISAKMATQDLLKIKAFWNKGHGITISVHDVTNKILSRDSNYFVEVVVWSKFGNSRLDQKKRFFWGVVLVQVQ